MYKRILIAFAALVAALALTTSSALAASSTSLAGTDSEAQASCNYLVWAAEGVNLHVDTRRDSDIAGHRKKGHVFYGVPCDNREGGNYGSCGTGFIWKSVGRNWVAAKCLTRV